MSRAKSPSLRTEYLRQPNARLRESQVLSVLVRTTPSSASTSVQAAGAAKAMREIEGRKGSIMADEESRQDFTSDGRARRVPIPVTPISTAVQRGRREPAVTTGSLRRLNLGGASVDPSMSSGSRQHAVPAPNITEIVPAGSGEAPAVRSAIFSTPKDYFRTAMQYILNLERSLLLERTMKRRRRHVLTRGNKAIARAGAIRKRR